MLDNVSFSISRTTTPKQACKLGFQCNGSFTSFSSLVARCCCLMIFFWTTTDIRKPFKISQRWMLLLAWRPLPFLKGKNPRISLYLLISFRHFQYFNLLQFPFISWMKVENDCLLNAFIFPTIELEKEVNFKKVLKHGEKWQVILKSSAGNSAVSLLSPLQVCSRFLCMEPEKKTIKKCTAVLRIFHFCSGKHFA